MGQEEVSPDGKKGKGFKEGRKVRGSWVKRETKGEDEEDDPTFLDGKASAEIQNRNYSR